MGVPPCWQFGDFRFDPEARLLTRRSRCVELSPKALEILAALVRHAGHVVSKDDLLDIVWPDVAVEEGNLAVHIFALRRALGEDAASAAYIETIPKRGYRFAAPISPVTGEVATAPGDPWRIAAHYLQQQTTEGCRRAAALYREYLAHETGSVKARVGLANTLLFRFVLGDVSRERAMARAHALLGEAQEIDPGAADLHLSRSRLFSLSGGQERAEEELQRALESADDDEMRCLAEAWHGFLLAAQGDMQGGLTRLRRSSEAYPLSTYIWRMSADAHFLARDFEGCVAVSRKGLQLHPSCCLLYRALGRALTSLGEYRYARRYFRRAVVLNQRPQIHLQAEIAYLDAVSGDRKSAADFLSRAQTGASGQQVSRVGLGEIYAALGNHERALDCLEEACGMGDWALAGLQHNSRLDAIRKTSRYRSVLRRLRM